MWYLRLVLWVLILAAVILFALANIGEQVTVRWWNPNAPGAVVSLTVALVLAYLLGFFTLLIISLFREIRLRRRCGRLERQMLAMREELNALRTAPFEEPLARGPGAAEPEE